MFINRKRATDKFCPLAGSGFFGQCGAGCAWRVGDECAMAVLAKQARRQGDELYAMAEIMIGNTEGVQPADEDAEGGGVG